MSIGDVFRDKFIISAVCLLLTVTYFFSKKPTTPVFTKEEKDTLYSKLPQKGSQAATDYGTLKGDKVVLNSQSVKELGKLDLIIVGGGIGGLTVGSIMSQAGFKVLVLNHTTSAGGSYASTSEESGFEFSNGKSAVVGGRIGTQHSSARKIMDAVTGGFVEWLKVGEGGITNIAVKATDNNSFTNEEEFKFFETSTRTAAELKLNFPTEIDRTAIDNYFNNIKLMRYAVIPWYICKLLPTEALRKAFSRVLHFPLKFLGADNTTINQLKVWTSNEKLIEVLLSYSGTGDQSTWFAHALSIDHYDGGSFYPKGGPSGIALSACEVIRKKGGQVLNCAPVSRLVFDDETDMGAGGKKRSGRCW
jgi:all-trans-retinol 13,14-reductase